MKRAIAIAVVLAALALWWVRRPSPCEPPPLPSSPETLYDLARLTDPATLGLKILSTDRVQHEGERILLRRVRYRSFEWKACALKPVDVEAYLAMPSSAVGTRSGRLAGLVRAHGLEPMDERSAATTLAAEAGVATLAYLTPSDGPDDVFTDSPRNSFFFRHVVNAIRGLTVLASLPEVDASKLAMTGLSGGGIATFIVSAIDERVKAAAVWYATGYADLAIAARPNPAWTASLLAAMDPPRDASSAAWTTYLRWFDPSVFIAPGHPDTLLIEGAQDPYFPIDTTAKTYADLESVGGAHRLHIAVGWGHQARADADPEQFVPDFYSTTAWWLRQRLFFPERPVPRPRARTVGDEDGLRITASIDAANAVLYVSHDAAQTFQALPMTRTATAWTASVSGRPLWFVDATLLRGSRRIRLSSAPAIPSGFVPFVPRR